MTDGLQPDQDHSDLERCTRLNDTLALSLTELAIPLSIRARKPC